MELEGQASIVTGAGRGIGRAIALELASWSDIVVADVLDPNAEQVAEEIHALGRQAIPIHVDVTSRPTWTRWRRRRCRSTGGSTCW